MILFCLCMLWTGVVGYPGGAPQEACKTFIPRHKGATNITQSFYWIYPYGDSYTPGKPLPVTVGGGTDGRGPFTGLIMQAYSTTFNQPVGRFMQVPQGFKVLSCRTQQDTVTHADKAQKPQYPIFIWDPPRGDAGEVVFRATVVHNFQIFQTDVASATLPFLAV